MIRLSHLAVAVACLIVAACSPVSESFPGSSITEVSPTTSAPRPATTAASPPTTGSVSTASVPDPRDSFIAHTLAGLSLEDKVAQLIMVEFSGSDGSAALELLDRYPLAGFLLKSANGNLVSSSQTRDLTVRLQAASTVPLLLAVDQEGGRVDRIDFADVQRFPSAAVFGLLDDEALTERAAWATGVQLAALGINVDFAPVADVNMLGDANPAIGDRSYGSDPDLVARMTVAALQGFDRAGIAAAVKHYPGHGNTTVDSHLGLPVVDTDIATWEATDLVPFAAAVDAGAPMVMVAHVAFPELDPTGVPASLSSPIVGGRLRQQLGFAGVVVTDDLANMAAVAGWSPGERAVGSLIAGADLLLNPGDVEAALTGILNEVEANNLEIPIIDAAVSRILGLKYDLGLNVPSAIIALDQSSNEAVAGVADDVTAACVEAGLDC